MDAGKSTLMGHLLFLLGNVNKRTMHKYEQESKKAGKASFAYAWVLDETGEERDRYPYGHGNLNFYFLSALVRVLILCLADAVSSPDCCS